MLTFAASMSGMMSSRSMCAAGTCSHETLDYCWNILLDIHVSTMLSTEHAATGHPSNTAKDVSVSQQVSKGICSTKDMQEC